MYRLLEEISTVYKWKIKYCEIAKYVYIFSMFFFNLAKEMNIFIAAKNMLII